VARLGSSRIDTPEDAVQGDLTKLPAWKQGAIIAAVLVLLFLALCVMAEAAVRIRFSLRQGDLWNIEDTYVLDAASGLRIPIPNGHFGNIVINSSGFRSPEISRYKPPTRLRIAFLGGSTTYCAEASSNEATWPHLVWKAIKKRYPKLDLDYINAGVPGYTTKKLLLALKMRVSEFHPDIIVIYEATNDMTENSQTIAEAHGFITPMPEAKRSWLSHYSLLALLVEKNLAIIRMEKMTTTNTKFNFSSAELAQPFRNDLTKLIEESRKDARIVAVATFSPRIRASQNVEQRRAAAITDAYYMPFMSLDGLVAGYRTYNDVIRSVASAKGALLIGDENAIPSNSTNYNDSVHFTDIGSRAMAARVSNALLGSSEFKALVTARAKPPG
jgi:lysophospholipase L1-like esterase